MMEGLIAGTYTGNSRKENKTDIKTTEVMGGKTRAFPDII